MHKIRVSLIAIKVIPTKFQFNELRNTCSFQYNFINLGTELYVDRVMTAD